MQQSRLLEYPKFSAETLEEMARKIRTMDDTMAVLVYESAPHETESAVILVVTSDQSFCDTYIDYVKIGMKQRSYYHLTSAGVRFARFCELWTDFQELAQLRTDPRYPVPPFVDIMVVTSDWKKRLLYFENEYYSDAPKFLHRLAKKDPFFVV
jgi:hypothetical protein